MSLRRRAAAGRPRKDGQAVADSRAADVLWGPWTVTSLMNNRQPVVGWCLVVALGLAGGCRPAAQPSKPPEARSSAKSTAPVSDPAPPSANAKDWAKPAAGPQSGSLSERQPTSTVEAEPSDAQTASPEQVAAAKKLAQDMGVVIKENAAGHVILLDTAAKRSWVDDYQLQEMLVFPQLESLTVEGPSISHVVAPQIAKLTALSALAMRNTLITNEGIAELKGLQSLKVIDLRLSPLLDDTALESLAEMPQPARSACWASTFPIAVLPHY